MCYNHLCKLMISTACFYQIFVARAQAKLSPNVIQRLAPWHITELAKRIAPMMDNLKNPRTQTLFLYAIEPDR